MSELEKMLAPDPESRELRVRDYTVLWVCLGAVAFLILGLVSYRWWSRRPEPEAPPPPPPRPAHETALEALSALQAEQLPAPTAGRFPSRCLRRTGVDVRSFGKNSFFLSQNAFQAAFKQEKKEQEKQEKQISCGYENY